MRQIKIVCMSMAPWVMALFHGAFLRYKQGEHLRSTRFQLRISAGMEPGGEIAASEDGYALKGVGHVWAKLWDGPWEVPDILMEAQEMMVTRK